MVISRKNSQSTMTESWLSAELAATVEADAALRELLSPVHRWLKSG